MQDDYLNFKGLSYFFNKLKGLFSLIGHTHTEAEITDISTLVVTDDDNGNVTVVYG